MKCFAAEMGVRWPRVKLNLDFCNQQRIIPVLNASVTGIKPCIGMADQIKFGGAGPYDLCPAPQFQINPDL